MASYRLPARILACLVIAAGASAAWAGNVVRIARAFSTQDGLTQFVELRLVDVPGAVQGAITSLRTRDANGSVFGGQPVAPLFDPPAHTRFTIAIDALCQVSCDVVPWGDTVADAVAEARFLPTGGGTIELVGPDGVADAWTYQALPDDGRTMLDRDAGPVPAEFGTRTSSPAPVDAPRVLLLEFVHEASGSYFMTSRADEIIALETGRIPGWSRTDNALFAFVRPMPEVDTVSNGAQTVPVCRLLLAGPRGFAHHYTASAGECEALRSGGATLESDAIFHAAEPDPLTGDCPVVVADLAEESARSYQTGEVLRFWDGAVDPPRHRLVKSSVYRDEMLARGWIPEGYGPRHVALCM